MAVNDRNAFFRIFIPQNLLRSRLQVAAAAASQPVRMLPIALPWPIGTSLLTTPASLNFTYISNVFRFVA